MGLICVGTALLGLCWVFLSPLVAKTDHFAGGIVAVLGALFVVVGLTLVARPATFREQARVIHAAIALSVLQLAVGTALAPLWKMFFSRVHRLPWLTTPLARWVDWLGLQSAADASEATIGIANERTLLTFAVNAESLGLHVATPVLVCTVLLLAVARAGLGSWCRLAAAVAAYLIVRYSVLVYLFANIQNPDEHHHGWISVHTFSDPHAVAFSFVPLALVLSVVLARSVPAARLADLRLFARLSVGPVAALSVGALFLCAALLFVDPGREKRGRILIDDHHSGLWEPSTEPLDTASYGDMSVYNLTSLREFLAFHYPVVEVHEEGPLTSDRLAGFDVLVLKTPTFPLSVSELDAVERFVKSGGGLWLIGDHTNLLGMGTYINAVAERFGLRFRYDACNALSTGHFGEWSPPALVRHPVMQRVPWFRLLTSATLEVSWSADLVMVVPDLLSDPIDYSKPSFFGEISPDPGDDFGVFPLAAANHKGHGRVLAFADSTVLSSFAFFKEGHVEFTMAAVDFLNHENGPARHLSVLFLLAGAGLTVWGLRRLLAGPPAALVGTVILALGVGGFGGALLMREVNLALHAPPEAHTEYPTIAFVVSGGAYHLAPAISQIQVPAGNEYSTFFVGMQRLGLVPRQAPTLAAIDGDEAVVMLNPSGMPSAEDRERLESYVAAGGRLLLMMPDRPPNRAASVWLETFGMSYEPQESEPAQLPSPMRFGAQILESEASPRATELAGGELLPTDPDLPVEVRRTSHGQGRVVVVKGSGLFSRAEMGHVTLEPDEARMKRYDLQFLLMYDLLGLGTPAPEKGDRKLRQNGPAPAEVSS